MKKKRILYWFIGIIITLIIVILFWSYKLCYTVLHPQPDKATYESMGNYYPQIKNWLDSVSVEGAIHDTIVYNDDNEKMHAIWISAPKATDRTAVVFHGYEGSGLSMLMIGYMFNHNLGFNVLLPDLRGHGQSQEGAVSMGWKERQDLVKWVNIANEIFGGNTQIVLHGISMGGASTMIVAGESNLPPSVKCAVEDCGYTSVWDIFDAAWDKSLDFAKFPLLDLGSAWSKMLYGWSFTESSPLNSIRNCNIPMLFIHGEQDSLVPVEMVYTLYNAKPGKKELWILPGVDHGAAFFDYPVEYTERVKAFVNANFD